MIEYIMLVLKPELIVLIIVMVTLASLIKDIMSHKFQLQYKANNNLPVKTKTYPINAIKQALKKKMNRIDDKVKHDSIRNDLG